MTPEEEFDLYDRQKSWTAIFQKIHSDAQKNHSYSLKDARRPEYRNRNRYGDVSPYDHSRVQLQRNAIDYINASLVEFPEANRAYILTQGPLPNTAGHFWLMAWESNSEAILMLNRIVEKGQIKCYQYYPLGEENEDDDEKVFTDVGLKVTYMMELETNYHYTARVYQIQDLESKETKQIIQFHYTAWLDFAVPESCAFLDFLFAVRKSGALNNPSFPPIIHCSAGIGRSGTFCLIDTCLVLIEKQAEMNGINVVNVLMELRKYRMGLIQTPQQLRFSFQAIIEGAKRVLAATSNGNSNEEICSRNRPSSFSDPSEIEMEDPDSDSLPDTPPPIPPRTGQATLKTEIYTKHNSIDISTISNGTVSQPEAQLEPEKVPASDPLPNKSNITAEQEIRRRNREERIKNTSGQIARMKQRQKENELRQSREKKLKPYVYGLLAVVAVGGYILYRCYWT